MTNFLGVGFKFPFSVGPNGALQLSRYETNIEESVRIIIGRNGKVRHVHVISAFASQAQTVTDAMMQW